MNFNVNICTKDSDLQIKYGIFKHWEEREMARSSVRYMLTDINDIKTNYIRLGFHLWEFDRCEYYKDFGYLTLAEFCDANLGMDKSAVSRCMNVFERFAVHESGKYSMRLDPRYEKYSYSQLCEMSSMLAYEWDHIKPDMTIKQIREKKKELRSGGVASVATSQLESLEPIDVLIGLSGILAKSQFVTNIYYCNDFISWTNKVTGKHYRLRFEEESGD